MGVCVGAFCLKVQGVRTTRVNGSERGKMGVCVGAFCLKVQGPATVNQAFARLVRLASLLQFDLSAVASGVAVARVHGGGHLARLLDSGSDLLLGRLDGLLFEFVFESASELVEDNSEKGSDEGSDNEKPDVT